MSSLVSRFISNRHLISAGPQRACVNRLLDRRRDDHRLCIQQQRRQASWLADFMEARLSTPIHSPLIFSLEQSLINFHQLSGLNWWLDVVLVTCGLKMFMTLPLNVWREKQISKRTLVDMKLHNLVSKKLVELKPQVQSGLITKHKAWVVVKNETDVEKKRLIQEYNCHGGRRAISVIAEIAAYICYFLTLRNLCCVYPSSVMFSSHEMTTQGAFWFTNLLQADPSFILPLTVGLVTLANSEVRLNKATERH